jgi:hypothetical protein
MNAVPNRRLIRALASTAILACASAALGQVMVSTTQQLVDAVNNGPSGSNIIVAPGTYELPFSLKVKNGVTITGAGAGQTIIRNAPTFQFPAASNYDADVNFQFSNRDAYLFDLGRDQSNITLRNMTLTGPQVYGGVHAIAVSGITLTGIEFSDFRWSGIRAFVVSNVNISNNRFIDAGGQTVNSNGSFGSTGGSMFIAYLSNAVIDNNRFSRSGTRPGNVFGVKGREFRNVRITNNTIRTSFAIELPFENDYYVDIENNYLDGEVSVPKWAGGALPPGPDPYTFRIRNNYFTKSYSIEGPHNGMYVENNVFDFPIDSDYGNLMASFDPWSENPAAPGPLVFNNNIVINPGRGVFWSDVVWNNLTFANNHILANEIIPSANPEGLFSFRSFSPALGGQITDFSTISLANNIVEVLGRPRALIRWPSGYAARIENNLLVNLTDSAAYPNPPTAAPRGPQTPLIFNVGVNGEFRVHGPDLLARARRAVLTPPQGSNTTAQPATDAQVIRR